MNSGGSNQTSLSQAESIYLSLKADIMSFRLKPGSMIFEDSLAGQLGVSRTPVREALRRLSWDGLVQCLPKKGNMVSALSINDLREIAQARVLVEPAAARLAASRIPQEEIDRLRERCLAGTDRSGPASETYQGLHKSIARHCGNSRLERFINSLLDDTSRARGMIEDHHRLAEAPHHRRIIEALQARDDRAAEEAMHEHLLATRLFAFVLDK